MREVGAIDQSFYFAGKRNRHKNQPHLANKNKFSTFRNGLPLWRFAFDCIRARLKFSQNEERFRMESSVLTCLYRATDI